MIYKNSCMECNYYLGYSQCLAFEKIPEEVWNGQNSHTSSIEGDNGIMYNQVKEKQK